MLIFELFKNEENNVAKIHLKKTMGKKLNHYDLVSLKFYT